MAPVNPGCQGGLTFSGLQTWPAAAAGVPRSFQRYACPASRALFSKTRLGCVSRHPSGRLSGCHLKPLGTATYSIVHACPTASGWPKCPNRDPIEERGGVIFYRVNDSDAKNNIDTAGATVRYDGMQLVFPKLADEQLRRNTRHEDLHLAHLNCWDSVYHVKAYSERTGIMSCTECEQKQIQLESKYLNEFHAHTIDENMHSVWDSNL